MTGRIDPLAFWRGLLIALAIEAALVAIAVCLVVAL